MESCRDRDSGSNGDSKRNKKVKKVRISALSWKSLESGVRNKNVVTGNGKSLKKSKATAPEVEQKTLTSKLLRLWLPY